MTQNPFPTNNSTHFAAKQAQVLNPFAHKFNKSPVKNPGNNYKINRKYQRPDGTYLTPNQAPFYDRGHVEFRYIDRFQKQIKLRKKAITSFLVVNFLFLITMTVLKF